MFKKRLNKKGKMILFIIASLLIILIAIRIALPHILLKEVNKELTHIKGYYGHVDDLDVALLRGAYTLKEIKLDKTGGEIPVPFFLQISSICQLNGKPCFMAPSMER
jgi:hypothetical protein